MSQTLSIRKLKAAVAGQGILKGLDLEVPCGEVHAVMGPNGSGKSTSIDCISGFQRSDRGRWFLDGVELTGLAPHRCQGPGPRGVHLHEPDALPAARH